VPVDLLLGISDNSMNRLLRFQHDFLPWFNKHRQNSYFQDFSEDRRRVVLISLLKLNLPSVRNPYLNQSWVAIHSYLSSSRYRDVYPVNRIYNCTDILTILFLQPAESNTITGRKKTSYSLSKMLIGNYFQIIEMQSYSFF